MEFWCKDFGLNHSFSTMKVGTDSILLASVVAEFFDNKKQLDFMEANSTAETNFIHDRKIKNILDVGTGCGILSLCMATIFNNATVTGIDIDNKSIIEARKNCLDSPFRERIQMQCISIQNFTKERQKKFDLIISNPPYFTSSLPSPDMRKNNTRHNDSLSLSDFVNTTSSLLNKGGYIAVILPNQEMNELMLLFRQHNISIVGNINIFTKPKTSIKRKVCIFAKPDFNEEITRLLDLYIRDSNGDYSAYYKQLTSRFLL
ncbi:MAG: tRNA1(Val) (adenine(37)-N6)-methyltransferase [Bacteroidales bacterium]